ncbi:MAG: hypothetical protein N2746_12085 [Deltaproteobacteria bacterium]|nr:hypothetical protein [Deltaproteobacteria bacterium]
MSNISPIVLSGIDTKESTTRQVPKQNFSKILQESLSTTSRILANGVAVVAPELNVSKSIVSTINKDMLNNSPEIHNKDTVKTEVADTLNKGTNEITGNQPTTTSDLLKATKALQEANWHFSLEYLSLQEKVQSENRYFSTVSNIMRTRHDSAKNAINNLR